MHIIAQSMLLHIGLSLRTLLFVCLGCVHVTYPTCGHCVFLSGVCAAAYLDHYLHHTARVDRCQVLLEQQNPMHEAKRTCTGYAVTSSRKHYV